MTTRPTDPGIHPDADDLEALRTDEASEEVRRHVDGCAACRGVLAELGTIASRLAGATSRPDAPVPGATDRAVVETLFAEAARIRRARRRPRLLRYVAAAAAVLLLAIGAWQVFLAEGADERAGSAERARAPDPLDVDRSGGVDIVDAYLVARRIRRHEETPGRFDVNGDGAVDAGDVDALARAAVSLERTPR